MTAQPTNPLTGRQPPRAGKVTVEMLETMAADFNKQRWVINRGWHYRVATDEHGKAFLDRRETIR